MQRSLWGRKEDVPRQLHARAKLPAYADRQPVRLLPPGSGVKLVDVTSCPPTYLPYGRAANGASKSLPRGDCPLQFMPRSPPEQSVVGALRFLQTGMSAPCLIACLARPTLLPTLHIETLQPVSASSFKIHQSTIASQTIADLLQASNAFKSTVRHDQNGE